MNSRPRSSLASVALFLCLAAQSAEPTAPPAPKQHLVFAHYMVCFTNSVEFCKAEIELAQRHGLDGFALDFGGWGDVKDGKFEPGNYTRSAERMFEAAKQLNSGFKLLLTPEYSVQPMHIQIADVVKRFYNHPNLFRYRDRAVVSSYLMDFGAEFIAQLKKDGFDFLYVPFVDTGRFEMNLSFESTLRIFRDRPHLDGLFRFVCDDSVEGMMRHNSNARRATQWLDKIYLAGVAPHYASANIRDMQGMRGYGAVWESLIRDGADWVEIVTWNDYNEDTNLNHYKWQRQWDKPAYNRDGSFLDVTSYYAQWFKTGAPPAITQDRIYFAYRNRSRWDGKAWDAKQNQWVDVTMGKWPFDQIHDDVRDAVYVTAFLTAPAELTVSLAGNDKTFSLPAGIGHAEVPQAPGIPTFRLTRGGKTLLDVVGRKKIVGEATPENSPNFGHHLHNRIWAGGAVAGVAQRFEAEGGKLDGGATIVERDGRKAVATTASPGSGFTLPMQGLKTAMYNVRVVYSNAAAEDARLTLVADGTAYDREQSVEPYTIPVFLPPTSEGRFATASFLFTLYDKTTFLKLEWQPGAGKKKEWDDVGQALIDAIELVPVEPFQPALAARKAWPQMIAIPGGSFTMGVDAGNADEKPAHKVTLSPFAMGRFEVTNAEFERFDPKHRAWRDGYSWRDSDPVIYISWLDAAKYCNWLSEQSKLKPVYREEKGAWLADLQADGFRLPTEAEWEYVATGRGEGRAYPWGSDPPRPMFHGNFDGAAAVDVPLALRASVGAGTAPVGSYPAGASRDGLMDLAGNVAEWCSDWYQYYKGDEQDNPLETRENHSRVLRGGSWGYYGHSQRCADREFNSQGYPGYIYIGFRVAIAETGWKKLDGK